MNLIKRKARAKLKAKAARERRSRRWGWRRQQEADLRAMARYMIQQGSVVFPTDQTIAPIVEGSEGAQV